MARPTSTADLTGNKEKVKVATFTVEDLVKLHNPELFTAYLAFAEAATKAGATFEDKYGGTEVHVPRSTHDLKDQLNTAQREWDKNLRDYHDALQDVNRTKFDYRFQRKELDHFAEAEGFPKVDWTQREDVDDE